MFIFIVVIGLSHTDRVKYRTMSSLQYSMFTKASDRPTIVFKKEPKHDITIKYSTKTQPMYILKKGAVDVYVPQHLNYVPDNDWANHSTYMGDRWASEETGQTGLDNLSNEDWLEFYTYIEEDTGCHIFNGNKDWPTHLRNKYNTSIINSKT